jgi:dihydrofolate reductase
VRVSLLAAVAANGVIGRAGGLPWHIPADLRYFKRLTVGHTLIMGRRTWDSVGRPLPGRCTVVLTRQAGWQPAGGPWAESTGTVEVVPTLDAALARAGVLERAALERTAVRERSAPAGAAEPAPGAGRVEGEIFVVGGAEIYREALPVADRLYLTRIEEDFAGDTHFPAFDPERWRRTACDRREPEAGVLYAYRFEVWDRAPTPAGPAGLPALHPV